MANEYTLPKKYELARLVQSGTGSKRITIPKHLLIKVLGNSEYVAIYEKGNTLLIQPVEIKVKEYKSDHK